MVDYEELGVFYLGKRYDLDKQECLENELLLYESRDLLTHAVCVGMTGSGKTGLCIDLLEEAAIDNIPVIALDLKGDIANLLLTFPDLAANSFLPYVDADEAKRSGLTAEALAENEAQKWKNGLAAWQQDAGRIARLKESAEFALYTPASSAARQLSVLSSFKCPVRDILEDRDLLREQIAGSVTSILALLSMEADPLKSREHILLSSILDSCWRKGENLDLHDLIGKIQSPPLKQFGAVPLEDFFPKKERFELAMSVNNLIAAPGFEAWLEGEALDIDRLLYDESGKNKVSIISIAHLSESERMFFVSLLLTQLLSWMRRQSGTSSLRALFYMDEIFGYFPPVKSPPSKAPLLTLLKQARAFGLGLVLATQNPVDLDYKALGNAGTWFIGRLQTERDKMRVLDGLESAAGDSGSSFNRAQLEKIIASLSRQVFLMNNVHAQEPLVFKTRWSLSYLRGPLSRAQLKSLNKTMTLKSPALKSSPADASAGGAADSKDPDLSGSAGSALEKNKKPVLNPEIIERFAPVGRPLDENARLVYKPMLFVSARLRFLDAKSGVDHVETVNMLSLIKSEASPVKWEKAFATTFGAERLLEQADARFEFADLPPEAGLPASYKQWAKDLIAYLCENRKLEIFGCPVSGAKSRVGESEREFRIRLQQAAREKRDSLVSELSRNYENKLAQLQEKLQKAKDSLERELNESRSLQMESAITVGTSLFQALVGRKVVSSTNIRRASSAVRKAAQVNRQEADVEKAQENLETISGKIALLQSEFAAEMAALKSKLDPLTQNLDSKVLLLKKSNVSLSQLCLCWSPCVRQADGRVTAAW